MSRQKIWFVNSWRRAGVYTAQRMFIARRGLYIYDAKKDVSRKIARIPSRFVPVVAAAVVASCGFFMPRAASAQSIEVLRPVANAIVRETVPIKVSPRDVPPDGYVSISVDDDVIVAKILPQPGQPVFLWDTKEAYVSADDPTTKKFVADGTHNVTVTIYSSGNHLVGSATLPVRVANKISVSPQGAMLRYKWQLDEDLTYHRKVTVTQVASDATSTPEATPSARCVAVRRHPGGYPGAGGGYPGYPGGGYPGAGGGYPGLPRWWRLSVGSASTWCGAPRLPRFAGGGGYPGARGPYGGGFPGAGGYGRRFRGQAARWE